MSPRTLRQQILDQDDHDLQRGIERVLDLCDEADRDPVALNVVWTGALRDALLVNPE